jgi:hypothetical protein
MINVIGIVAFANPEKKTRTNGWSIIHSAWLARIIPFPLEWGRSFTLVDPSTVGSARQSIKVNCFQKKYLEWLPQVQKDDVVILRKLKVRRRHRYLSGIALIYDDFTPHRLPSSMAS